MKAARREAGKTPRKTPVKCPSGYTTFSNVAMQQHVPDALHTAAANAALYSGDEIFYYFLSLARVDWFTVG
jgi:hypothetical protein